MTHTYTFGLVRSLKICNLCFHMKTINNPIIQIYKNKISNCEDCVILLRHHNIEAVCELKWDVREENKKRLTMFVIHFLTFRCCSILHTGPLTAEQVMILGWAESSNISLIGAIQETQGGTWAAPSLFKTIKLWLWRWVWSIISPWKRRRQKPPTSSIKESKLHVGLVWRVVAKLLVESHVFVWTLQCDFITV